MTALAELKQNRPDAKPDDTQALVDALYARNDKVSTEAALLIEWFLDQQPMMLEEMAHAQRLDKDCEQMCERLSRLEDHLRTLADYAGSVGHDELDNPPPDPFPPRTRKKP